MTFRPSPGCWLKHPITGLAFVAGDAAIANCGIKDWGFTAVRWPSGQRVFVLASSCEAAGPPKGTKPKLAYDSGSVQMPCDSETADADNLL